MLPRFFLRSISSRYSPMHFITVESGFESCTCISSIEGCDYIAVDELIWRLKNYRIIAHVDESLHLRNNYIVPDTDELLGCKAKDYSNALFGRLLQSSLDLKNVGALYRLDTC